MNFASIQPMLQRIDWFYNLDRFVKPSQLVLPNQSKQLMRKPLQRRDRSREVKIANEYFFVFDRNQFFTMMRISRIPNIELQ